MTRFFKVLGSYPARVERVAQTGDARDGRFSRRHGPRATLRASHVPTTIPAFLRARVAGRMRRQGGSTGGKLGPTVDADPLALLPGSAVVVANLDARAMYASASVGATLASFAESAGAPRRQTPASWPRATSTASPRAHTPPTSADVAVVRHRSVRRGQDRGATKTKTGGAMVHGTYAGFGRSTAGALTSRCSRPGRWSPEPANGSHRVLDRIQQGTARAVDAAMGRRDARDDGAQFAVAADFATQPIASATLGSHQPGVDQGHAQCAAIGDFDAPGVNVAATLTYPDAPEQARPRPTACASSTAG